MKGKGQRDQSRNHHHDRITNCQRCTWYGGGAFDIKISEISDHKYCKAQETIIFQGRRPQRDFATCSIGNPSDLGWVWTSTLGENSRCWFSCQRRRAPGGNGVLSWNLPQKQLSRRTDPRLKEETSSQCFHFMKFQKCLRKAMWEFCHPFSHPGRCSPPTFWGESLNISGVTGVSPLKKKPRDPLQKWEIFSVKCNLRCCCLSPRSPGKVDSKFTVLFPTRKRSFWG